MIITRKFFVCLLAAFVISCACLAPAQETQEGRLLRFPDIYKDKVTEFLRSRPLARKTHTLRVAISDMANEGAALGAASLVLHAAYAPNTADLVSV